MGALRSGATLTEGTDEMDQGKGYAIYSRVQVNVSGQQRAITIVVYGK